MSISYTNNDGTMQEHFYNAVLATRERNYYDDSDFYAVCWDDENQKLTTSEYASTRYGGGGTASVDASADRVAKANAWAYKTMKKIVFKDFVDQLKVPEKGDKVTVVKGRKVKVGTTGTLFWVGEKRVYGGYSRWSQSEVQKVGIALDDEKDDNGRFKNVVWTYMSNIEADVSSKFKYSDAKNLLKRLKKAGWTAWTAYQSYPLVYVR